MTTIEQVLDIFGRVYGCLFYLLGWLSGTAISAIIRGWRVSRGYDYEGDAWES